MDKTTQWVHAVSKFAQNAEMLQIQQSDPSMQNLFKAIELVGATLKNQHWMWSNDPDRRLDQALKILIGLTSPKNDALRPLN